VDWCQRREIEKGLVGVVKVVNDSLKFYKAPLG